MCPLSFHRILGLVVKRFYHRYSNVQQTLDMVQQLCPLSNSCFCYSRPPLLYVGGFSALMLMVFITSLKGLFISLFTFSMPEEQGDRGLHCFGCLAFGWLSPHSHLEASLLVIVHHASTIIWLDWDCYYWRKEK